MGELVTTGMPTLILLVVLAIMVVVSIIERTTRRIRVGIPVVTSSSIIYTS